MILHLFTLKNRLSGIYERPVAEIYDEKEYPEMLTQSLALAPVDMLERHKEFDIYYVGEFDSKSGEIKSCDPEFVMSLEGICLNFIASKGSKDVSIKERVEASSNV